MAPVQSGMLLYCSIMVKYGTRPFRDVAILQYYGKKGTRPVRDIFIMPNYCKIRHPSSHGC